MAYIVVPNLESGMGKMAMRTDFFRPVHLNYFTPSTFQSILKKNGLMPVVFHSEGEIWGLFKACSHDLEFSPEYSSVLSKLQSWKFKYYLIDSLRWGKIVIKSLLPRRIFSGLKTFLNGL